jgi:hypothetical protein
MITITIRISIRVKPRREHVAFIVKPHRRRNGTARGKVPERSQVAADLNRQRDGDDRRETDQINESIFLREHR